MSDLTTATRRGLLALLLVATSLSWGERRAGADEGQTRLETRIFRVGALVMGKADFYGEASPPVHAHSAGSSENPLFGAESEECSYPVGMRDELIELCKSAVRPHDWERIEGADLASMGADMLIGRGPGPLLDAVGAFLALRESAVLGSVRVEVQAVRTEPGQDLPREPAAIETLCSGPRAGPALALVAGADQRVSATGGRQVAYVGDYDTEVAQEATISDPAICVANLGLMVDARVAARGASDRWLLTAWIRLAELEALRKVSSGERRPLEVPSFVGAEVSALVETAANTWTLAGSSGPWAFYVRLTPRPHAARPATGATLPALTGGGQDLAVRYHAVADLATSPLWSVPVERYHLWPSRFTPPEPPELREPEPFLAPESLVELLLHLGGMEPWQDPASVEIRDRQLIVRAAPGMQADVERVLGALRRELLYAIETQAEVVELPAQLAARLAAAPTVDEGLRTALAQARREGAVHTVGQATVHNRRMTRGSVQAGRHLLYLQDYEAEIAQGAVISNPIVRTLFSGLTLDLLANATVDGEAACLEVRFTQSGVSEPIRTLETPDGAVELPELDVYRVRTSLVVPFGETVALSAWGAGDRRRVVLLTSRLVALR